MKAIIDLKKKIGFFGGTWMFSFLFLIMLGCGTLAGNPGEDGDEGDETLEYAKDFPDVRSINLNGVATQAGGALHLTVAEEEEQCAGMDDLGVFGLALGVACHTSPFVEEILYGKNGDRSGDGVMNCEDYDPTKEDQGFLLGLLCEENLLRVKNIEELKFLGDGFETAISFKPFVEDENIVGAWSATGGSEGRYPANIRAWLGDEGEELPGVLALDLKAQSEGKVYFDFTSIDVPFKGEMDFSLPKNGPSKCSETPNIENCYYQQNVLKMPEEFVAGADAIPPGMRFTVLADSKENPKFIMIEGKFRYSESIANAVMKGNETLDKFKPVREVYLRVIKKENQLWGSFDYKDELGQTMSAQMLGENLEMIDLTRILRDGTSGEDYAGICQNVGSDEWVDCTSVDYKKYEAFWFGDDYFKVVSPSFELGVDFSGQPESVGIKRLE